MPSPFPGMDPWLESTEVWRGFHSRVINVASDLLQPQVMSLGFFIDIDERIWLEEPERNVYPDLAAIQWTRTQNSPTSAVLEADEPVIVRSMLPAEVREPYLQIFDQRGQQVVTQIELISPANKSSSGRELYIQKRRELKTGGVNVVEIDLLRAGDPIVDLSPAALNGLRPWDYITCISRPASPDHEVYCCTVRDHLPKMRIPLRPEVPDVVLDLQAAVQKAYDSGPYTARLNYRENPRPALKEQDAIWAAALLEHAGLRS